MIESYLSAFLVGLMGGVHCAGMCGGIVGALCFGLPEPVQGRSGKVLPFLLAYNAGRLLAYGVAGALVGGIGLLAADLSGQQAAREGLQVVAGLFMVALGLYLGGWWLGVARVERLGGSLWQRIDPLARRLLPVRSLPQAFAVGLVWGWLPCALVYSTLIWAMSAGGPLQGALLLLAFGLGTLPNLLAMGLFASKLARLLRRPAVRRAAGLLVIAMGGSIIARLFV